MKKAIKLNEGDLRSLINDILSEDVMPSGTSATSPTGKNGAPPLPGKKPGAAPNLKGFKADCSMMADAAGKVKQILDAGQGNTKEALRWLDKVLQYASSAKKALGQG